MVKVGIVGPGILWETRYRPALERLAGKISVRAIYDSVASRAEQVAAEWKALPVQGILALAELPDVQALLLIDAGWAGRQAISLLSRTGKPVYLSGTLGDDFELLDRLRESAQSRHLTLMPEFSLRHTPSTARLHELMATKLGRPSKIRLEATSPLPSEATASITGSGLDFLVGLFDWCRYVVRTSPTRVEAQPDTAGARAGRRIRIEFARSKSGGQGAEVELVLHSAENSTGCQARPDENTVPVRSEIQCEHGMATITSATEICWMNGAAQPTTEFLTSDRTAVEVMLDHFCRRVVGGLIPIAGIDDVCRGVTLARAVESSFRSGRAIPLDVPESSTSNE